MSGALSQSIAVSADAPSRVGDYWQLLKPRVMSLVVFTGITGMVMAPGEVHPLIAAIAILCIALGSGAAGAINMWYERDIDAQMPRTKHRPIPMGRIAPDAAIEFAVFMAGTAVFLMAVAVNFVAAALLLSAILFYVFVYTVWLKPRTPQNIVIGGAAGAFPPIIGWAAVTGSVAIEPILLFLIIFFWTPPHFWALSLVRKDEYADVGIPMLPVVRGVSYTRRAIVVYSVVLVALSFTPLLTANAGVFYGVGVGLLGAGFLWYAWRVWKKRPYAARGMFGYSIVYLFTVCALLILENGVL